MGTKRPGRTIYDTVPTISMSEHNKLQPGGKISRDPSPRPAMTAQTDRGREGSREDEWRRDRDADRRRDKEQRYKEPIEPPRDRYYDRDRGPKTQDGERDRRHENRNVRPLSNIEMENEKEGDRGIRKGDTFPRSMGNHGQIMLAMEAEREERRRRKEGKDRDRERDRPKDRDDHRSKGKDEGRGARDSRERDRHREFADRSREGDDRGDRYGTRKANEKQRADKRPRPPPRMSSPERRREREMYRDKADRREGKRDTRSEGEIDERQRRKERVRVTEEMNYQHSRSEGETRNKTDRERREYRDQERYKEKEDGHRYREDRYRDNRESERAARDRGQERPRQQRGEDDRRREERYRGRDYEEARRKDRPREQDSQTQRKPPKVPPRAPPRAQSSGEWSSDMDGEAKVRTERDEREMRKERKMWLEPHRGQTSRDSALSGEDNQNRKEKIILKGYSSEETKEMNVDGDVEWSQEEYRHGSCNVDSEENTEDSEGGSDAGWTLERERMVSAEDGFMTVSSGDEEREDDFKDCVEYWDEDRDTEDTVDEEELSDEPGRETPPKFVFCVIGQTEPGQSQVDETAKNVSSVQNTLEPVYDEVTEFVEIPSPGDTIAIDGGVKVRSHSCHDFGTIKRDSETEKLLLQWREQTQNDEEPQRLSPIPHNPYSDVPVQVPYDQIQSTIERRHSGAVTPEEEEAIRIRMSGAWSMSEETKRHSQAPHLKWATSVVREILGKSDENMDDPQAEEAKVVGQNAEIPQIKAEDGNSEEDLEEDDEEESVALEGLRGMATPSQAGMHAGLGTAMHGGAPTHTHTLVDAREDEPTPLVHVDEVVVKVSDYETSNDAEVETYLTASNTLYKPNSCPSLNCESDIAENVGPEVIVSRPEEEREEEAGAEGGAGTTEEEEEEEDEEEEKEEVVAEKVKEEGRDEVDVRRERAGAMLTNSVSFRDLGSEARLRRRGIRKTTQRRKEETVKEEAKSEEEEKEVEGVGRDRRTRIFSTSDDEDTRSKSWGELDLRNVLDTIGKRKRNSKFFNAAQLYQQYSEAAQNFEIQRQARSDVVSICEGSSPASSPPPARRPLPPLPQVSPHPHSLGHHGSVTSVQSLPLPQPPRSERRASSPRLSVSLGQSATLWRDQPAVRNHPDLQELREDQRKLQEVRFEVVTSEASYCRSLDIVVEHFVKSKQLGSLLTTQDRSWLFSRLADVRAISHSFLLKLEEKVESDILHFTVCDVISRHCQRFKMVYVPYLTNQSYQDATYQRLMNENQGFRRIVEKLERSPVCQRLPLRSFLVLPFQRITRIKLLVQNIVKRTTPGTAEATQAIKSLKLLEKLIQEGNDSITQMKSIESLVSLSAKVDFECKTLPLISQSRRLVREGKVTELMDFSLKETERTLYLHLFNDYLLLSQQKEGGRFTVIDTSPVSELRAENCRVKLHSLQKNLFRLHMFHKALLLRTDTQSDKLRWISAMSRPHPEVDFSAAQDFPQMQCIRAFVAQQPDELSLEKADIILVHQQSSDHWVEGTRLSDRHRGWIPESHLETISNSEIRKRNLSDALKLTTATAQV